MDVLAAMGVSLEEVQAQARKHAQQARTSTPATQRAMGLDI